jgi:DNA-binding response OmpR family regulator
MTATILIIEDEEDLANGLEISLRKEGYAVLKAATGEVGVDLAIHQSPHLVLLDVMLPGKSGLDVCRELRHKGFESPMIMLTARSEELDRVLGLELGADDYITKPFSLRELLARIRVQLRKSPRHAAGSISHFRFGAVEIDFEHCRTLRNGEPVELTSKEYDILKLLIRRRGEIVTRDQVLTGVWGYDAAMTTRTVDNHILRLRQKIEDDPANPQFIRSVYGEGYKFVG